MEGSIILAGLLLKLGGFGIVAISPLLPNSYTLWYASRFSGLGAVLIGILCLRQMDIKVLIAYSSVAHMGIAIICGLGINGLLFQSLLVIMFAHGVSSPAIFLGAFYVYTRSHSRSILISSANLLYTQIFSLW